MKSYGRVAIQLDAITRGEVYRLSAGAGELVTIKYLFAVFAVLDSIRIRDYASRNGEG